MIENMNRAAREVTNTPSIYSEIIWQGLTEAERRSLRETLEASEIASRVGQYLDNDVYFLAVTPEDRSKAVEVMHRATMAGRL